MAVYTEIADDDLARFLEGFDLGTAVAFKGIAEGVSNSNYLLETTTGRYILTVYEVRSSEADLPYFLALMDWLKDNGFPSAKPIRDRSGATLGRVSGKSAAIVEFLPGLSVRLLSHQCLLCMCLIYNLEYHLLHRYSLADRYMHN